jgi:predicted AlkP superfamily phosphohydrolase/phosphomutase
LQVYVSPVNLDPLEPAAPISRPASYSARLARAVGRYTTLGMPSDTAALRQHVLDRSEYLAQSRAASREHLALFRHAVAEFRGGLLFFHFAGVDEDSHMLWGKFENDLLATYRMVDEAIGDVRRQAPQATLIVMSDHGFTSFERAVNLNTWLLGQGLLRLKTPLTEQQHSLLQNVDWSTTRAYALGLNSLYLNRRGRERSGIVSAEDAVATLQDIADRLHEFRDPESGKPVVTDTRAVAPSATAPDLVVGYAAGYRCSWDGALGEIATSVMEDNQDEWIGDHCMDPRAVPGVLLGTRPSHMADAGLQDMAASILALFGLPGPAGSAGREIY